MRNVFLIYLLCLSLSSFGRDSQIDSLFQVWENIEQPDENRLKSLHTIIKTEYLFSQPDSAFYYAQLQYDFAKNCGLKKYMALSLNTQGVSFSIRGDYNNAIKYYHKSLLIREQINDKKGITSSLINIGNVYYEQGNYKSAIEYFNKSLEISKKTNNKKAIASVLNNLGIIYKEQNDHVKAIDCFNESLKIKKKIGDSLDIANTIGNLGVVYSSQGDYNKAIRYFDEGLKIQEEIGDKRGMAGTLINLGSIYNTLGNSAKKTGDTTLSVQNYIQGIKYSERALKMAKEVGAVIEIRDAAMNLYLSFKQNGSHKKSLEMHELYMNLRDSIENIETQRLVIEQDFSLKYEKKNLANKLAHQQERYALIVGFVLLLMFLGVYIRVRYIKRRAEKEILLQEIKLLKVESVVKMAANKTSTSEQDKLNKKQIEAIIEGVLNPTDWNILNALYNNPVISNKEIAEQVSLSVDGVRSSLRKMYRLFEIQKTNENQRISLVIKATRISNNSFS